MNFNDAVEGLRRKWNAAAEATQIENEAAARLGDFCVARRDARAYAVLAPFIDADGAEAPDLSHEAAQLRDVIGRLLEAHPRDPAEPAPPGTANSTDTDDRPVLFVYPSTIPTPFVSGIPVRMRREWPESPDFDFTEYRAVLIFDDGCVVASALWSIVRRVNAAGVPWTAVTERPTRTAVVTGLRALGLWG